MENCYQNSLIRIKCKKLYSVEVAPDVRELYERTNNPHADKLIENTEEFLVNEFYNSSDSSKKSVCVKCYYNYRGVFTLVELTPYLVPIVEDNDVLA